MIYLSCNVFLDCVEVSPGVREFNFVVLLRSAGIAALLMTPLRGVPHPVGAGLSAAAVSFYQAAAARATRRSHFLGVDRANGIQERPVGEQRAVKM